MTFAEIKEKQDGVEIETLKGIVRKVYSPKTGEGKWGPWIQQGMQLEDESGDKLNISLFGRSFSESHVIHQELTLIAFKDKGMTVNVYNGKKSIKVNLKAVKASLSAGGKIDEIPEYQGQDSSPSVSSGATNNYTNGGKQLKLQDLLVEIDYIHDHLKKIEPGENAADARMATLNTLLIAITNGKVDIGIDKKDDDGAF